MRNALVYINNDDYLQKKGVSLSKSIFIGGPKRDFERMGREQLVTLLRMGVYPHSKVLDIGCGCLRGGYWLIHFLKKGCYFGIEPNAEMLEAGKSTLLEDGLIEEKQPRFAHNDDFTFGGFEEKFDFCIARSIWSHTSKAQIQTMLDQFVLHSSEKAVFLASYLKAGLLNRDYKGLQWVGKSHESNSAGMVFHSTKWIRRECEKRGLPVTNPGFPMDNGQRWLRIERTTSA